MVTLGIVLKTIHKYVIAWQIDLEKYDTIHNYIVF